MPRSARHGLTLIEFIVVLAIVGVTMAMLLPAVRRVRPAAERTKCLSNLRG